MTDLPPLREFPLFARLEEAALQRMTTESKVESYHDGETIFRQGDLASATILVVKGFVKLLRVSTSGDETVVSIKSDGASITGAPCSTGGVYYVSAEAVGPTTTLKIPASRFLRLMADEPTLAIAALDEARRTIAELVGEIESLKSHSAEQRLARFLLALCPPEAERRRFRLPYDKRLIAARLGVTQETLSRAFARLRDVGIRTETRDVFVESAAKLRAQFRDVVGQPPSQNESGG